MQSLFTIHLVPKSGVSGDAKVTLTSITAKAGATNNLGGTLSGSTVTIGAAPPPPPPPTTACGNNKQEVGEDCDGSTSASCPSGKEGTVTCANCKNDFSGCKDIGSAEEGTDKIRILIIDKNGYFYQFEAFDKIGAEENKNYELIFDKMLSNFKFIEE